MKLALVLLALMSVVIANHNSVIGPGSDYYNSGYLNMTSGSGFYYASG